MTDFQIPDGIEPVVGWRYWRLDDDGVLQSLHHTMLWLPRERVTATCRIGIKPFLSLSPTRSPVHVPPGEDCKCGIYAAASLDDLRNATYALRERLIVGELYLWGDIVLGETGYRGHFAYPKALYVVPEGQADIGRDTDEVCAALSERYGVPVGTMAALDCEPFGGTWGQVTATFTVTIQQFGAALTKAAQAAKAFGESMERLEKLNDDGAVEALKKLTGNGADVQTPPRLPARRNWTLLNKTPKRVVYQTRDRSAWGPRQP